MSKWVGSKTPSNLVNLRAGEFARRQQCAGGRRILAGDPCGDSAGGSEKPGGDAAV